GTAKVEKPGRWPGLTVHDLRGRSGQELDQALLAIRERLSHRRLAVERAEVFDLQLALLPGGNTRLYLSVDLLVADVLSIQIILRDLAACYTGSNEGLPPIDFTFAGYLAEQGRMRGTAREEARSY